LKWCAPFGSLLNGETAEETLGDILEELQLAAILDYQLDGDAPGEATNRIKNVFWFAHVVVKSNKMRTGVVITIKCYFQSSMVFKKMCRPYNWLIYELSA
jgi:hypothetical protein